MLEKMKEMIADQLSVVRIKITLESKFKEDLDADSLDLFELVMALEDEYGSRKFHLRNLRSHDRQ